jgi:hypothetical protein
MNSTIATMLTDFQLELEAMKKAREDAYTHLIKDTSKEKCESKLAAYKFKSALKYETHIRTEKHAELQEQLSTISASTTS